MEFYCQTCGIDVKPTGLNTCPTCDEDLSQDIHECQCGNTEDLSECKICGDSTCKEHTLVFGECLSGTHVESEICMECLGIMEED